VLPKNQFKVKRPYLIAGIPQPADSVIFTDDDRERDLLNAEEIEPANETTAPRFVKKTANCWKPGSISARHD
jgi:hypothetical protein